jgi:hypothetical protein
MGFWIFYFSIFLSIKSATKNNKNFILKMTIKNEIKKMSEFTLFFNSKFQNLISKCVLKTLLAFSFKSFCVHPSLDQV